MTWFKRTFTSRLVEAQRTELAMSSDIIEQTERALLGPGRPRACALSDADVLSIRYHLGKAEKHLANMGFLTKLTWLPFATLFTAGIFNSEREALAAALKKADWIHLNASTLSKVSPQS